jgi:hypothetical protein
MSDEQGSIQVIDNGGAARFTSVLVWAESFPDNIWE